MNLVWVVTVYQHILYFPYMAGIPKKMTDKKTMSHYEYLSDQRWIISLSSECSLLGGSFFNMKQNDHLEEYFSSDGNYYMSTVALESL